VFDARQGQKRIEHGDEGLGHDVPRRARTGQRLAQFPF
jgi:hypothetical protein